MRISDHHGIRDRIPWMILLTVFVVQLLISIFFCINQWTDDISREESELDSHLKVLQTIVHSSLQTAQYQEITPLLDSWITLHGEKVESMKLLSGNGFVFFDFHDSRTRDHTSSRSIQIQYSYQGVATLSIQWSLEEAYDHLRRNLIFIGVIQLITLTTLAFFLRLALLRKRDAQMLSVRAGELDDTNQVLHQEMLKREEMEKNLAREKEQLQITIRSLGEGVIRINKQGRVLLLNDAAEEMIGCSGQRCMDLNIDQALELREEDSGERFLLHESGYLRDPGREMLELVLHPKGGPENFIALTASSINEASGEILGWVIVLRDNTQTRRLQHEQSKNAMLQALGVLAGGIAHDFNNLLMTIAGNVKLALELSEENPSIGEFLSDAAKASDRAAHLTRQLLTFARGGSPILHSMAIDEVVRESAEFAIHGADVRLEYDFDPNLLPVLIDKHQIGQVIQNLIINARQAMPSGGCVRISCSNVLRPEVDVKPPAIQMRVSDEGKGISETDLENIFDPYYTTRKEGSGLGLAVVHSIINRHKGHIHVQSTVGEGTTFIIHLPASLTSLPEKSSEELSLIRGEGLVLVMEDDPAVQLITSRMLEELGYDVITAEEGGKAIELYRQHLRKSPPVSKVIMDLTIPRGMGGIETMKRLLEIDPDCHAIVASGYSNDPVLAHFEDYGFEGALTKPFTIQQLSALLDD